MLGEFEIGRDPDCVKVGVSCSAPIQKFTPSKIIAHELWDVANFRNGNDIMLIRLDRPAELFYVS